MTPYEARLKRIQDAVALKEPDRVPIAPIAQCYPIYQAGYTMAEALYDFDKGADSFKRFYKKYEPDYAMGHEYINIGCGPILELMQPKTMTWAGAPDGRIDKNSIHQHIEFPILVEGEFDRYKIDCTGWLIEQGLPKVSGLLEPMSRWGLSDMHPMSEAGMLAAAVSTPESRKMIETLWKINDLRVELWQKTAKLNNEIIEMGIPVVMSGGAGVPFDGYSNFHRGTLEAMVDMFEREDVIMRFKERVLPKTLAMIEMQAKMEGNAGKWLFMALHKGMDGFMSDAQYRKYYWDDLQAMIETIIKAGMVPYVYTEGPYNSRLDCLKDITPGKAVYHFEQCDMARAKKVLGDVACISGGFPVYLLHYGKKEQVIDEAKRLIDICAPGGGFIFETSCGFDDAKPENVEAMVDTVKTYGKR